MDRKLKKLAGADGISSLPDAILVEILSLVPLKSAVSTAVLSRRWRHLWTQTTSVDIDSRHLKEFHTTVDQLLPKLTSPIIRNFTLCLPLITESESALPPRSLVIGTLLRWVCGRKVEKIEVTTEGSGDGDVVIDTLPSCIFQTPSLLVLVLGPYKLDYKLPVELEMHDSNINIPNLVKLHLNLYASQCGLFAKMIRCCPLLEELRLDGVGVWKSSSNEEDGFVVDISNANVKRMDVSLPCAPKSTKIVLVVDVPKLTSFSFMAAFVTCSFVRKPVSLRKTMMICSCESLRSLIPVICNVVSLSVHPLIFYIPNGGLGEETAPWSFPNLRHLYLHCGSGVTNDNFCHNPVDSVVARRLLLGVKRIVWHIEDVKSGKKLLYLAKVLLRNAPVLERFVVRVTDQSGPDDMNISC